MYFPKRLMLQNQQARDHLNLGSPRCDTLDRLVLQMPRSLIVVTTIHLVALTSKSTFSALETQRVNSAGRESLQQVGNSPVPQVATALLRQQDGIDHVDHTIGRDDVGCHHGCVIDLHARLCIDSKVCSLNRLRIHGLASNISGHDL